MVDITALAGADRRAARRQLDGPHWATVRRVSGAGLMVTIDPLGEQRLVGPCAWQQPSSAGNPPAGTRCLVVSPTGSVSDVAVIMFAGWPAGGRGQA